MRNFMILAATFALAACGNGADGDATSDTAEPAAEADAGGFTWSQYLSPTGDGYPAAGDPCRVLEVTSTIAEYAVDGTILVGCPTEEQGKAIGGESVVVVDGAYIRRIELQ